MYNKNTILMNGESFRYILILTMSRDQSSKFPEWLQDVIYAEIW